MKSGKTILVVEDFVAVQRFIRDTLEAQGYQTLGAIDGKRAYELLLSHSASIDLIITDYHMPGETGYDLLKKIMQNPVLTEKPVLFLTSESKKEVIDKVKELAPVLWITKPYKSEVLFDEIRKALNESTDGDKRK